MTWEEQLTRASTSALLLRLKDVKVFALSGRDHVRYLHNRCTQEIKGLREGEVRQALILTPSGRTQGVCTCVRMKDSFLLTVDDLVDERHAESFCSAFLQFKVADDVQLDDLSESYAVYSLQGVAYAETLGRFGIDAQALNTLGSIEVPVFQPAGVIVLHARGPFGGCDLLVPRSAEGQFLGLCTSMGLSLGDESGREALRIAQRIPRLGSEVSEKIVASDLPLGNYVSFTKGCYAGQETVEMATARGKPNRELRVFCTQEGDLVDVGASILLMPERKAVGSVSSAIGLSAGNRKLLLAFVKYGLADDALFSTEGGELVPVQITEANPADFLGKP